MPDLHGHLTTEQWSEIWDWTVAIEAGTAASTDCDGDSFLWPAWTGLPGHHNHTPSVYVWLSSGWGWRARLFFSCSAWEMTPGKPARFAESATEALFMLLLDPHPISRGSDY